MSFRMFSLYLKRSAAFALIVLILLTSALAQSKAELSKDDREEIFEKVWKSINEKYYDPNLNGVNWLQTRDSYKSQLDEAITDDEFYSVIKQMVSEMGDAHTRFLTPREAYEFKTKQTTTAGILIEEVEGKIVVSRVSPDSEALNAGIKPGMEVTSIDGAPIAEKIAAAKKELRASSSERASKILLYRKLLDGEPDTKVKIGLNDFSGKPLEFELTRRQKSAQSQALSKRLPSGFGYISLSRFMNPAASLFQKELESLKDAPGLIVDLRYNGGGNINEVQKIATLLVENRTSFGKVMTRSKPPVEMWVSPNSNISYRRPVVILLNSFSASGSELLSSGLQEAGRVKVIGAQSCGCLLGISQLRNMKGGGELHLSELGFLSSKGKVYEKIGVTPDIPVELTIADLQNGIDRGIEQAETALTELTSKKAQRYRRLKTRAA